MENASSAAAAKSSSLEKKMEIDTSSSAKSTSSMDCSPAGSKCSSMDCSPAGSKRSSAGSKMDEDDVTPEKMDCSYKTASSTASNPSVNSPPTAAAASKKKSELTWELNEDGVKVYTLKCGCGDMQRLIASDGNIFRITL